MTHFVLLASVLVISLAAFLALMRFGIGAVQTSLIGMFTVALIWGALHLAYVSDALYHAGIVDLPASVAWQSVPFAWLWRSIAVHGWVIGVSTYIAIWLLAALARAIWPRPNTSSKPTPPRGAA